jgi:hypothetical protein
VLSAFDHDRLEQLWQQLNQLKALASKECSPAVLRAKTTNVFEALVAAKAKFRETFRN